MAAISPLLCFSFIDRSASSSWRVSKLEFIFLIEMNCSTVSWIMKCGQPRCHPMRRVQGLAGCPTARTQLNRPTFLRVLRACQNFRPAWKHNVLCASPLPPRFWDSQGSKPFGPFSCRVSQFCKFTAIASPGLLLDLHPTSSLRAVDQSNHQSKQCDRPGLSLLSFLMEGAFSPPLSWFWGYQIPGSFTFFMSMLGRIWCMVAWPLFFTGRSRPPCVFNLFYGNAHKFLHFPSSHPITAKACRKCISRPSGCVQIDPSKRFWAS